jgi:hypothetical protein
LSLPQSALGHAGVELGDEHDAIDARRPDLPADTIDQAVDGGKPGSRDHFLRGLANPGTGGPAQKDAHDAGNDQPQGWPPEDQERHATHGQEQRQRVDQHGDHECRQSSRRSSRLERPGGAEMLEEVLPHPLAE